MNRLIFWFVLLMLGCALYPEAYSQATGIDRRTGRLFENARSAWLQSDFSLAIDYLNRTLARDANFAEAWILLAEIHRDQGNAGESIAAYRRAIQLAGDNYPLLYYFFAEALFGSGIYDEALEAMEVALQSGGLSGVQTIKAETIIGNCHFALEAKRNPLPFNPVNAGAAINTPASEYSPAISADGQTLVFTRKEDTGFGRLTENFYFSHMGPAGWMPAYSLGHPLQTDENEGAASISSDGRELFFTACNRPDGLGSCDIFYSVWENDRWKQPLPLPWPLNTRAWESHPSISADGKWLYFVSNREGGMGASDIYVAERLADGSWKEPVNLGLKINTPGREMAPFIHADGKTLYFSSDGHTGMGGLDLFIAERNDQGIWSRPRNLGYPVNTHADESSLVVSPDGTTAYFASNRPGGFGGMDIYTFSLPEPIRPAMAREYSAEIKPADPVSLHSLLTLDSLISGALPRAGVDILLQNIYFDTGSAEMRPESHEELGRLANYLNQHPGLRIQISGHTDNTGSRELNLRLSYDRARGVADYLQTLGIAPGRLEVAGYADTMPVASNDTREGRALNRRTVFSIIGQQEPETP